jgi:hypothetical protein
LLWVYTWQIQNCSPITSAVKTFSVPKYVIFLFLRSTISLGFKNLMLCLTQLKLRFWLLGLGVSEVSNRWHRRRRFHVMADCCVEWLKFSYFSMQIIDEFIKVNSSLFLCNLFVMSFIPYVCWIKFKIPQSNL